MKFQEYRESVQRTMPMPESSLGYSKDQKTIALLGLAGEVGEFLELIKKDWGHGHKIPQNKKKDELGDIMFYVFEVCEMFGWNVEEVATMNIVKRYKRYPNGFSTEDSIKRVDVENGKS